MQTQNISKTALRHYTSKIKGKLDELIAHLREDVAAFKASLEIA